MLFFRGIWVNNLKYPFLKYKLILVEALDSILLNQCQHNLILLLGQIQTWLVLGYIYNEYRLSSLQLIWKKSSWSLYWIQFLLKLYNFPFNALYCLSQANDTYLTSSVCLSLNSSAVLRHRPQKVWVGVFTFFVFLFTNRSCSCLQDSWFRWRMDRAWLKGGLPSAVWETQPGLPTKMWVTITLNMCLTRLFHLSVRLLFLLQIVYLLFM